jgi:hypothetical protein
VTWTAHHTGNAHFLRAGHALLNVHQWSGKDCWWLSCVEADVVAESLGTEDVDEAKRAAVAMVRKRLAETLKALEDHNGQ